MGWVVRVHDARDLSVFHDVPADSLKDANEIAPLHRRSGAFVKVMRTDDVTREVEQSEPQQLEPDTDLVLEEDEMPMAKGQDVAQPVTKKCATKGCKGEFEAYRNRQKCDDCQTGKPVAKKPGVDLGPPSVKPKAHAPAKVPATTPYDGVLRDLRAKRGEISAAVESMQAELVSLDDAIAGIEKLAGAA